ncbi:MAG: hypothetical protein NTW65_01190 [Deltaproteobacteria bacterium]|nr:hypothetical protein [Deltaproteobacteria bacterium]
MKKFVLPILLLFSSFFVQGCVPGSVNLIKNLSEPLTNYKSVAVKVECSEAIPADTKAEAVAMVKNMFISKLTETKKFQDIYNYDEAKDKAQLWIEVKVTDFAKDCPCKYKPSRPCAKVSLDGSFINAKTNLIIGEIDAKSDYIIRAIKPYNTKIEVAASFAISHIIDFIAQSK